jgi:hypothetical protein
MEEDKEHQPSRSTLVAKDSSQRRNYWTLKRISLVIGFVFALVGSVGQYAFVDRFTKYSDFLGSESRVRDDKIQKLQSAYFNYFSTQQMGAMLFALSPSDTARQNGVIADLYKGNLLDRAIPFRYLIGYISGSPADYSRLSEAYQVLTDKARSDFSFENYQTVNRYERDVVEKALARIDSLLTERSALANQKALIDQRIDFIKLLGFILSSLGLSIMLFFNVLAAT